MAPARLTLIRHGNTECNGLHPNPRMSGWTDFPLSEIGRRQASALRSRMMDEPAPVAIYSSPLQRAHDTALALAELCSSSIQIHADLRELNCGIVDGLPIETVRESYGALWAENLRQEDPDFRWPGGESYRELRERSLNALNQIAANHPGERVLVVTHCGVISQVVGTLNNENPARWERFRVENTSVTELLWSSSDARAIISFDDRSHLFSPAEATVA